MVIVYAHFVMDIVHRGHIEMLQNSKAIAGLDGRLILGILTNEAAKIDLAKTPIMPFEERVSLARSIQYVDAVVVQHSHSPLANLQRIRPDVLMQSDSHNTSIKVADYCKRFNIRIVTIPYFPNHSSTTIKQQVRDIV